MKLLMDADCLIKLTKARFFLLTTKGTLDKR